MELPEEILVKIYSYILCNDDLDGLHRSVYNVNKEWRAASLNSYILRKIDSSLSLTKVTALATGGYLKYTEELDLSAKGRTLKSKQLKEIFENTPSLKSLNLSNSSLVCQSFRYLIHNCPDLEALYLQNLNKSPSIRNLKIRPLKEMLKSHGHKMKILDFSNNYLGAFSIIKNIPMLCPNLEELHLADTGDSKIVFPTENFQKFCPNLKVLRLGPHVICQHPQGEVVGFKELEVFTQELDRGNGPSDKDIKYLLGNSKKLKLLNFKGCSRIVVKTLLDLPACDVEYLYLSNSSLCESCMMPYLIGKWRHSLKVFDISKTNSDSVNSAIMLLEKYGAPNLKKLILNSTSVNMELLPNLLEKLQALEVIDVENCENFDFGIGRVYEGRDDFEYLISAINWYKTYESGLILLKNCVAEAYEKVKALNKS